MHNYSLNIIIASTVFGSLILFGFINFLFILRKRFSIKVNCWFCNTNLRVPYNDYNSFTCIVCQQYNGFDEYGNYNKEIPAQHYSKHNPNTYCQNTITKSLSHNGFCEFCSRNQELKVLQLANFKPRMEEKYDEEIEEFRQKLEDSYQLCSQCQRHLNRTLNRVKTKFIGSKISQLKAKSLNIIHQSNARIITDEGKLVSTLIILSILFLSIVNFQRDLKIELPPTDYADSIVSIYNHFNAFLYTLGEILLNYVSEWELGEWIKDINIDNVAASAIFLNLLLMFWNHKKIHFQIVISMISWAVKMISNEIEIDESYLLTVKGSIASFLVISSLSILINLWKKVDVINISKNETSFHKITTDICEDSDNECDTSENNTNSFCDWKTSKTSLLSSQYHNSFRSHSKIHNGSFSTKSYLIPHINDTKNKFNSSSPKNFDILSNKSFSIVKEVNSAERKKLQNDITRLKLSDNLEDSFSTATSVNLNSTMNPFSLENCKRGGSPTPSVASIFTSASQRNLISPPRLHSPQVYMNDATTSWVAGGYWTSPQKKFIDKPVISRSSSQSSGLGTIDSEKNSRENSLAQDEILNKFLADKSTTSSNNFNGKPPLIRSLFENSMYPPSNRSFVSNSTVGGGSSNLFSIYGNNNFNKYRNSNVFM